ncbi:MAG TPA: diguanylate cyclase [Candidatus Limnocylindrales bacterium]
MTLRTRLTTAFLAMVLGPVVLGAVFVSATVQSVSGSRAEERLQRSESTAHTLIQALCSQLRTVAEAVSAAPEGERLALGAQFVERGLASGVHIDDGGGGQTTPAAPPPPWADCAGPGSEHHQEALTGYEGLAAYAGAVSAAFTIDASFVRKLGDASGADITLLPPQRPAVAVDEPVVGMTAQAAMPGPAVVSAAQTAAAMRMAVAQGSVAIAGATQGSVAEAGATQGSVAEAGAARVSAAEAGAARVSAAVAGVALGSEAEGSAAQGSVAVAGAAERSDARGSEAEGSAAKGGEAKRSVAEGGAAKRSGAKGSGAEAGEPVAPQSTLGDAGEIVKAALGLKEGETARTAGGDLVRRLGPVPGQPLPMAVSLRVETPKGMYAMLILVVLGCAVAAVVAAWWLARTTTNPLVGLAAAADRVAAGDLETRVPSRGKDEIGRLAAAFNHMTRELSTYVSALTASRDQLRGHLGVLGDTLSSTHDLDRILQVILQTARHATGAASGVVLLADSGGVLIGKCAEGTSVDVRVAVGDGLVGSVAATGVPRMGRVERDGPRLDPGETDCQTYVVVPFCVDEQGGIGPALPAAKGVLALYDRHGRDEFDESDLDTLRTFAGQAAVAVDNVRVHEEAQRLSVTDSLTGLFNHRSLRDTLRRETERAGRFGRRLAVLALDLDHFKEINDRHGHEAGDAVLVEFAQRIRYEIREVDVAFRHGGEEFALLLPETDEIGGIAVAERLCEAIRTVPIEINDKSVEVTVSIGVAVFPDHGSSGPAVLRAADEALYAAKTAGRDTFRVAGESGLLALGNGIGGASGGPQAPRQAQGR